LTPDKGEIIFSGRNIAGLPAHDITRLGISRTFQNLRLFPRLSVLDNVLCGLTVQAGGSMLAALLRTPGLRHRERRLKLTALEALDTFGLADKADFPAGALPYGHKKRVEMARAFVSQPVLTLLDEPVAGLNSEETAEIAALIRQMRLYGNTMVLVEHDMDLVMSVSDHVVVLDSGKRIAAGPPDEILVNPLVLEAYLGRMSLTA
jgi:ABC-type branched-subunit amino acid transport system ATPase component